MAEKISPTAPQIGEELSFTRVFDAPRDVVFKAWTDPKQVAEWWGPKDFTSTVHALDARTGGALHIDMRGPAGTEYDTDLPMKGVFEEVVRPERLVFRSGAFYDEQGVPGIEDRTTVTFEEQGGRTKITVVSSILKAAPQYADALAGAEEGWNQQLDKLVEFLAKR
jgi:uncharacterized protein YndB with AHSA1/START domain